MTRPLALGSLLLFGLSPAAFPPAASAEVVPAPIFGTHMVLQAGRAVPVFGTADPGEKVVVTVSKRVGPARYDDGAVAETTAGEDGRWSVEVGPFEPGTELAVAVTAPDGTTTTFEDVLAGDVWLCSGQSNMEWQLANTLDGDRHAKAAKDEAIRLFTVPKHSVREPQADLLDPDPDRDLSEAKWVKLSPEAAKTFSAVGYHFGRTLHERLGTPVGLIDSSWGGTPSEAWTRMETLEELDTTPPLLARWERVDADFAAKKETEGGNYAGKYSPTHPHHPANLNNGMIAPLAPFALAGAIWYQGESNSGRAEQYGEIFPAMIGDWRDQFGQALPFFWVQLANYNAYQEDPNVNAPWAELREAQDNTLDELDNVAQAVILDVGEADDIHPRNKEDVGERLALAALKTVYGVDEPGMFSPRMKEVTIDGATATVTFDVDGDALQTRRDEYEADPGEALGFTVAGPDRTFYRAEATVTGPDAVTVTAPPEVPGIAAVRYGWAQNPRVTLFNTRGLPAAPFRTDDWPGVTDGNY